jgi:hypothetical protein
MREYRYDIKNHNVHSTGTEAFVLEEYRKYRGLMGTAAFCSFASVLIAWGLFSGKQYGAGFIALLVAFGCGYGAYAANGPRSRLYEKIMGRY